ncbi:pyridoxal phosphate-dependent transferase [Suillus fuscotomentosus]|uniref:Pyridoxal phosphate-dependent transferase n=1 Tax=Suillus fuscotomentosus TaxID=1912939 RepID=A0AAD4HJD5_9AGAM|nr:pyridoxal phosphate-dependent transferase [Suillus fuscotomentosus]KAG1899805.1 pyridoxal phosphate-dependent transferase [Suillus fuscotomentosus]
MNAEQFRRAGYQAIDRICDYHVTLRDRPVLSQVEPGYFRKVLPSSAPTQGEDFQLIADDYQNTFEGILAELYASSTSNPGFNWSVSPAYTKLEAVVMDWIAQLLGLDESFYNISEVGGGVIQPSASESALVATVAARSRYIHEHPQVAMENLVLYTTTQTHSLGKKAGLDDFALRGDTLKVALEEDMNAGFHPFILIGTVGTTSSGAVDRLDEIADVVSILRVTKHYPFLWLHVDSAWAGVAFVCPEYREAYQLPAINSYVDSFCTSFYKWGPIQFDGSCLWVRHRKHLTDALDVTPVFLRTKYGNALGLGKRFRSLKFWFVLRARGVKGLQKYISDGIKLNTKFAQSIYEPELFSVITKPSLAMTVFGLAPKSSPQLSTPELNILNRAFYARLAARNDIALTQTDLNEVFYIRMVIGAEQTLESDVDRASALMKSEAMVLLKK